MSGILWMGSEDSWNVVAEAQHRVDQARAEGRMLGSFDEDDSDLPPLAEKRGDIGIVYITGSLVKGSAGWMRYYGVNGYDDIARAMAKIAADPDVKKLLFYVDSSGGQVAGLSEFSKLVAQLSSLKPSATFTDVKMASAAYWSGSAVAGPIYVGETAEVGSLGVLLVHMERTKMLANAGITVNVLRAGEDKARANPYEELSESARAQIEEQLADLHDMFKAHVKKARPTMSAEQHAQATTGKVFIGKRAVAIGLADRITSYDQALKLLDKNSGQKHTSSHSKGAAMSTVTMTPKQLAQIAFSTGKSLADMGFELTAEILAEAEAELATMQAEKNAADAKKAAEEEEARAAAAAATQAKDVNPDVVAHLTTQLNENIVKVASLTTENATLKSQHSAMKAGMDGLLAIARADLGRMLVAMNAGTMESTAAMDAATVATKHTETKALFDAKFPGGRLSKNEKDGDAGASATALPASFRALERKHASSQSTK
jgi:signal peptide peptidase SppA